MKYEMNDQTFVMRMLRRNEMIDAIVDLFDVTFEIQDIIYSSVHRSEPSSASACIRT
jgi:hypothetical protein